MLVGIVMYISVFKAEVGSKLRARSSFQVSKMRGEKIKINEK